MSAAKKDRPHAVIEGYVRQLMRDAKEQPKKFAKEGVKVGRAVHQQLTSRPTRD